jgi:hypothetical protein
VDGAIRFAIVAASGVLLWGVASFGMHTAEPWDSPNFWTAYLMAVGMSAIWGFVFPRRAWVWGLTVMYAQMPVMWFNEGEIGSLWVLGLVLTGIMAIPAVGAGVIASGFAVRRSA